jgi:hypothetical protein
MTKSECNLKEISNGLHRDQTRLSVSCRGFAIPRCSLLASCNRMQRSTAFCLFFVRAISHYFCLATAHAAVSALLSGHCYLPYKHLSVLVWPLLPTHCRCRDYCCTWSHSVTHTLARTPLDEGLARRRDFCYLRNTQHSQETDIHAPGGIRTRDPNKQTAADLRLTRRGHWDRLCKYYSL